MDLPDHIAPSTSPNQILLQYTASRLVPRTLPPLPHTVISSGPLNTPIIYYIVSVKSTYTESTSLTEYIKITNPKEFLSTPPSSISLSAPLYEIPLDEPL